MHPVYRSSTLVVSLLAAVSFAAAQPAADPSDSLAGHWEGAVQTPESPISVEIDLAKNSQGHFIGTLGNPSQNLKGLALSDIAVDGKSVHFQVKGTPGERAFKGTLSADGSSMSGEYTQAGYLMPFNLTRTGDARIEAAAEERGHRQGSGRDLERHGLERRRTADDARESTRWHIHRQHCQRGRRPGDPDHGHRAEGIQRHGGSQSRRSILCGRDSCQRFDGHFD